MRKEPTSVFNVVYAGRVLALIATVGFAVRGFVVPDELRAAEPDGQSFHVLVWMCFASLSLGLFCVLGVLSRLADGLHLK